MVFPFLARFAMEQGPRYLLKLLALLLFFKLAALLYQRHHAKLQACAIWLLPAAALLVFCTSAAQSHYAAFGAAPKSAFWIFWSMLESGGWACFIVAWLARERSLLPAWLERMLNHGGKVSYSFYLSHMALIHLLQQCFGLVSIVPGVLLNAAILLVLSYSAIEEPFLRMRRNYGTSSVDKEAGQAAPVAVTGGVDRSK